MSILDQAKSQYLTIRDELDSLYYLLDNLDEVSSDMPIVGRIETLQAQIYLVATVIADEVCI